MEHIPAISEWGWPQRYCRSGRRLPKTSYVNPRLKPRVGSEQVVRRAILLNDDDVFEMRHLPRGTVERCRSKAQAERSEKDESKGFHGGAPPGEKKHSQGEC